MSKKSIFIILIILIAAVALIGFYYYKPGSFSNSAINSVETKETTDKYGIDVRYPEFLGLKNRASQDNINIFLADRINGEVEQFKKDVAEGQDIEELKDVVNELKINYDIAFFNGEKVSLKFLIFTYIKGSAHPFEYYYGFNYDITNNKEIKLADLFEGDYLTMLSTFTRGELKKQMEAEGSYIEDMAFAGTEPNEESFSTFTLGEGKITIIFNPYQVGPWASGIHFVDVPL